MKFRGLIDLNLALKDQFIKESQPLNYESQPQFPHITSKRF